MLLFKHRDSLRTLSAKGFNIYGNLDFKLFLRNLFISIMTFPKKTKTFPHFFLVPQKVL